MLEINHIFLDGLQNFSSVVSFGELFVLGVEVFPDNILDLVCVLVFILIAKENGLESGDAIDGARRVGPVDVHGGWRGDEIRGVFEGFFGVFLDERVSFVEVWFLRGVAGRKLEKRFDFELLFVVDGVRLLKTQELVVLKLWNFAVFGTFLLE